MGCSQPVQTVPDLLGICVGYLPEMFGVHLTRLPVAPMGRGHLGPLAAPVAWVTPLAVRSTKDCQLRTAYGGESNCLIKT